MAGRNGRVGLPGEHDDREHARGARRCGPTVAGAAAYTSEPWLPLTVSPSRSASRSMSDGCTPAGVLIDCAPGRSERA